MNQITLKFSSIIEMIDFQLIMSTPVISHNLTDLTLTACFNDTELQLAKVDYNAVVIS